MGKNYLSMIKFLRRWLRIRPVVVRARRVADGELLETLAVAEEHPWLQAMLEMLDRQREQLRAQAKGAEGEADRMRFYLGGENALDTFQEFLLNTRQQALQEAAVKGQIAEGLERRRRAAEARRVAVDGVTEGASDVGS